MALDPTTVSRTIERDVDALIDPTAHYFGIGGAEMRGARLADDAVLIPAGGRYGGQSIADYAQWVESWTYLDKSFINHAFYDTPHGGTVILVRHSPGGPHHEGAWAVMGTDSRVRAVCVGRDALCEGVRMMDAIAARSFGD